MGVDGNPTRTGRGRRRGRGRGRLRFALVVARGQLVGVGALGALGALEPERGGERAGGAYLPPRLEGDPRGDVSNGFEAARASEGVEGGVVVVEVSRGELDDGSAPLPARAGGAAGASYRETKTHGSASPTGAAHAGSPTQRPSSWR